MFKAAILCINLDLFRSKQQIRLQVTEEAFTKIKVTELSYTHIFCLMKDAPPPFFIPFLILWE